MLTYGRGDGTRLGNVGALWLFRLQLLTLSWGIGQHWAREVCLCSNREFR